MRGPLRSALAIGAGFGAANAANLAGGLINAARFPELAGAIAANDAATLHAAIAATPAASQALLTTLGAWAIGSFAGGWLAARLALRRPIAHAVGVGALFLLGGIANNLAFPPPAWFWAATCAVFVPPAWWGGAVARRRFVTQPRA